MSITAQIYSNANSISKTVTVDFMGDILAASRSSNISSAQYFFKFSTSSRNDLNQTIPPKVVLQLSDLALNLQKQSASDDSNSYADINSMVVDYLYDYINGHTANQFTSGCTLQRPMKFT